MIVYDTESATLGASPLNLDGVGQFQCYIPPPKAHLQIIEPGEGTFDGFAVLQ